jgi:hypothetical protein
MVAACGSGRVAGEAEAEAVNDLCEPGWLKVWPPQNYRSLFGDPDIVIRIGKRGDESNQKNIAAGFVQPVGRVAYVEIDPATKPNVSPAEWG